MVQIIGIIRPLHHRIIQNARNPKPCHDIRIDLLQRLEINGKRLCAAGFPALFFLLLFRLLFLLVLLLFLCLFYIFL